MPKVRTKMMIWAWAISPNNWDSSQVKKNPAMNYEKLSRAMRYYYRNKEIEMVKGERLTYKFGPNMRDFRAKDRNDPNFQLKRKWSAMQCSPLSFWYVKIHSVPRQKAVLCKYNVFSSLYIFRRINICLNQMQSWCFNSTKILEYLWKQPFYVP